MAERHFLFLQGPHGPFFSDLAGLLNQAGARISRIGFNAGDARFWAHKDAYTAFTAGKSEWRIGRHGLKVVEELAGRGVAVATIAKALRMGKDAFMGCQQRQPEVAQHGHGGPLVMSLRGR